MYTRRSFGWLAGAGVARCLAAEGAQSEAVYVNGFVFEMPGRVQRMPGSLGARAVYLFYRDGRLAVLKCGLEYDFDAKRLRALLEGAVVERGRWREERGFVLLEFAELRGVAYVRAEGRGPGARKRLTPAVNPNGALVAAGDLANLREVERLAVRGLTNP